ncbi:MAG: tryptophan-rich sensory protein [Sphingobacteriales bacterium]|nr:tryptophan-rich sensory protein [Sphingobacteriales bacterium]
MNSFIKLFISIFICMAVGGISGYLTASEIPGWYMSLNKPGFNPPNWIFAPVWTTLYILMGVSFWLIWKSSVDEAVKNRAMLFFIIQLVLNFFWSIIFFSFHQLGFAMAEIVLLWIFILFSIISFYPISKAASYLLIPYICWVSFASVLNFAVWRLNS